MLVVVMVVFPVVGAEKIVAAHGGRQIHPLALRLQLQRQVPAGVGTLDPPARCLQWAGRLR